ncbi:MAG: cyclic pyranopterin monophosphate synthase MoaC [Deltaproteobacteria bacterium]|nr:cyclic pyranopterin monophosphate synthase MoaC [Deltaproteobacteria bacterium]
MSKDSFSHLNQKGQAHMVDVSPKPMTQREAVASGRVMIGPDAFNLLIDSKISKGDVLATARIAGIMAAKKVETLIPLCHPLTLQQVEIDFIPNPEKNAIEILARVKAKGATGVEMEALTAVSVAALTIYDMCKSAEKNITIEKIRLDYKTGGKSGTWKRKFLGEQ